MSDICIVCTRRAWLSGRALSPGTTAKVSASAAADALDSGRFELVNADDAAAVRAARLAAVTEQLRRVRQPTFADQLNDPQWQRR